MVLDKGWPWRFTPEVRGLAVTAFNPALRAHCGVPSVSREAACVLGAPGDDFYVIGDSHAEALLDTLDRRAREAGLRGRAFLYPACMPLPETQTRQRGKFDCRAAVDVAYAAVAAHHPRRIAVTAKWPIYTSAPPEYNERLLPKRLSDSQGGGALADNDAVILRGLERLATLFPDVEIQLYLNPPILPFDAGNEIARKAHFGQPFPPPMSRAELDRQQQRIRSLLTQAAARHPNLRIFALADALCPDGTCPYLDERGLLYADNNHVSNAGADFAAPALDPLFSGLPPKSR
jgi:hypothetical protein